MRDVVGYFWGCGVDWIVVGGCLSVCELIIGSICGLLIRLLASFNGISITFQIDFYNHEKTMYLF
jgi:hypothetical protein